MLEAGFEAKGRPCVLLLHGFPELAYSWRKVMLPLAAAGYPRHRARPARLRAHHRLGRRLRRRSRLLPHAQPGARRAGAGLGARLPLGGGGGRARLRLAGRGLVRAGPAGRVPLRGADERAVSPARRRSRSTPPTRRTAGAAAGPEHPRRARGADAAAQALPVVLLDARGQRQHAQLPAGRPRLPARLLPLQERGLEGEQAAPAQVAGPPASWRRCRPTTSWTWTRAWRRRWRRRCRRAAEIAACKWLPDDELARLQRRVRQDRLPGRPAVVSRADAAAGSRPSCELFSGRTIDVPSCFIAGKSDWGVYQTPGALREHAGRARARACWAAISSTAPGTGCSRSSRRPPTRLLLEFSAGGRTGRA